MGMQMGMQMQTELGMAVLMGMKVTLHWECRWGFQRERRKA